MNYVTLGGGLRILIPHNATYLIFFIGNHSLERDHSNVEQLGKQMKKKHAFVSWIFMAIQLRNQKIGDVDRTNKYQI
jgi:hypothetical protein